MGVKTRQQCMKLGGACCRDRVPVEVAPLVRSTAYNLRTKPHPGPIYYETRIRSRNWTSKRKPKAKPKPPPVARRCRGSNFHEDGDMEATQRCLRQHTEPMDVDTTYEMSDGQCEELANDRLVEAVENICSAYGIVGSDGGDACLDDCGSSAVQMDTEVYRRMFPEYAHELTAAFPDYSIVDLCQGPDIYYRIPVIEGGVVTPSWEEARCVVKQEVDVDGCVVLQDLPEISAKGNETPAVEKPGDAEDITAQQVSRNSSVEDNANNSSEDNANNSSEEDDWRNEVKEFCDTDSTPCYLRVPDVNNVGEKNEPEKHTQDDSDTDKPSDADDLGMFFGVGARLNWPSPTVFPNEKKND